MTDRELMQQALDALEKLNKDGWILADFEDEVYASIEALRARLAQPEPEPVAWADKYDLDREGHDFWVSRQQPAKNGVPLYTAPPQREWKGLTDEELLDIADMAYANDLELLQTLQAKLKEKNHG